MHVSKAMQRSSDLVIKVIKSFQTSELFSIKRKCVFVFWVTQLIRGFLLQPLDEVALINGGEASFQPLGTGGELQGSGDNHRTVYQGGFFLFAQIFGQRIATKAVANGIDMSLGVEITEVQKRALYIRSFTTVIAACQTIVFT